MTSAPLFARIAAALSFALLSVPSAWAQILIGQTSAITGAAAPGVKETARGAKLYFDHVNAQGGVHGQRIELISLDDKFDVSLAEKNAQALITQHKVVAMFMTRGTPHTEAIIPLLNQYEVPLVAPSTGAMVLHKPVQPYVFNVRATYQREAERAIEHLNVTGVSRIALLHVDDSFGNDGALGALKGFETIKKTPVLQEKFDRNRTDFAEIAPRVVESGAQAVVFLASAQSVAAGIRALRAAGSAAQVVTLSNNASEGFIKMLGKDARGVIITQVFPYERSMATRLVSEAVRRAKAKGLDGVSPSMIEGYSGAKVLVEALQRAGPRPTRLSILAALNGMKNFDLGDLSVSYSPEDHTGLDYSDLSIVDYGGTFRR